MLVFRYSISDERDHRVYVWGLADHGALGTLKTTMFDKGISYIPKPKRLVFGEKHDVTNITCGYGFTAFAVRSKDKNILYGSGINTDSQLGKRIIISESFLNLSLLTNLSTFPYIPLVY